MESARLGGRIALVTELDFAGRTLVVYDPHLESRSYGSQGSDHLPISATVSIAGDK
jgi:endonuclease/exonuclease/phosphatase family metal-dependent hydrolase